MIPKDVHQNQGRGSKRTEELPAPIYRPETSVQTFWVSLYGWLQPILFALCVLFVISTFFGRLIGVKGTSMVPTLHDKDMLVLQSIGYTPQNGDIVVLSERSFRGGEPIVKRVIATGGQEVEIVYEIVVDETTGVARERGTVKVDGQPLKEDYLGEDMRPTNDCFQGQYPVTVPEGHIFVLGDNRNHSSDSRSIGMIDARCVLGRAVWSLNPFGRIGG